MRIGSLFSGYGGLDLACEEFFGGTTAWVSDIDPGPQKVLAHRFPNAPNLGDITAVDWRAVEPVDVICGGSPCQDLSQAGSRRGMRDGTRSGLWASMLAAITTIRPRFVVWENVRGALNACAASELEPCPGCVGDGPHRPVLRALGRVLGDLAAIGFDAEWVTVRASDVGAPHRRERIFVLAWDAANPSGDTRRFQHRNDGAAPHLGHERGGAARDGRAGSADSSDRALTLLPTPTTTWTAAQKAKHGNGNGHGASLAIEAQRLLPTPSVADSTGGHEARGGARGDELLLKGLAKYGHIARWGDYGPAIARWEQALGIPAPEPTETNTKGTQRLSPRFTEWMMGLPAGWITDVPGVTRNEALKLCGNGVVPQQALHALRQMQQRQAAAS